MCFGFTEVGPGRVPGPLQGGRHGARRHCRPSCGRELHEGTLRRRNGPPHRLPGRERRGAGRDGEKLAENHGIRATEQKNRDYFRAVYFREPGGLLFEIATDDPGFAVDEPATSLGQALKLPRFLESRRPQIEAVLPEVA